MTAFVDTNIISRVALTRVLQGQAGISANFPVRIELAGVGTARAWLALQTNYDLAREFERNHSPVMPLTDAV